MDELQFEYAASFVVMCRDAVNGQEKEFCKTSTSLDALILIMDLALIGVVSWAVPSADRL